MLEGVSLTIKAIFLLFTLTYTLVLLHNCYGRMIKLTIFEKVSIYNSFIFRIPFLKRWKVFIVASIKILGLKLNKRTETVNGMILSLGRFLGYYLMLRLA